MRVRWWAKCSRRNCNFSSRLVTCESHLRSHPSASRTLKLGDLYRCTRAAINLNIYFAFEAHTQPETENFRLFSHFGMQVGNEIVQSNLGVIKTMWISRAMHFKCETRVPRRERLHFFYLSKSFLGTNARSHLPRLRENKNTSLHNRRHLSLSLCSRL